MSTPSPALRRPEPTGMSCGACILRDLKGKKGKCCKSFKHGKRCKKCPGKKK